MVNNFPCLLSIKRQFPGLYVSSLSWPKKRFISHNLQAVWGNCKFCEKNPPEDAWKNLEYDCRTNKKSCRMAACCPRVSHFEYTDRRPCPRLFLSKVLLLLVLLHVSWPIQVHTSNGIGSAAFAELRSIPTYRHRVTEHGTPSVATGRF